MSNKEMPMLTKEQQKHFMGFNGFTWWIGVVEDNNDPEKLGRVRVRCLGLHTENKNEFLPIPLVELELANAIDRWGQNEGY